MTAVVRSMTEDGVRLGLSDLQLLAAKMVWNGASCRNRSLIIRNSFKSFQPCLNSTHRMPSKGGEIE